MIEVLKKMVEALEWCHGGEPIGTAEAIKAGKQAIAELESQEPIGYAVPTFDFDNSIIYKVHYEHTVPLYTHPPQRTEPVALPCCGYTDTNAVKWNPLNGVVQCHNCGQNYTPSQRTEPPAWFPAVENILNEYGLQAIDFVADFKAAMKDAEQSQRTWVGLTDEEVRQMCGSVPSMKEAVREAEAKLKEKNT